MFAHAEACGFGHRSGHRTPISGSIKYRVLTRAKGRCECCGAHEHQRALEVDHILPRNQGGSDDLSNLQALCIADAHSGALFPAPGILATVQSDHEDFSALLSEIDGIGKSTQHHPADLTVDQGKRLRRDEDALNRSRNGFGKDLGQRRLTRAVPALGFQKIFHRLWQEANRGERHPRPSWLRTSSQGTAAPGLARWAVQRRSS